MFGATMGFVHVAALVLGLLSVGHSAPVTSCETLTQRVDIPEIDQLLGKWIYLADVTTLPGSKLLIKLLVNNMWVNITRANESDTIDVLQTQRTLGRCFSLNTKYKLENNAFLLTHPYQTSQIMLRTSCPDCMVLLANFNVTGSSYRSLQLSSRRTTLTPAELEEFKMQAECLNLPAPVFMDAETDLCPDEPVAQDTESETTDLTSSVTSEAVNEAFKLIKKISGNEEKLKKFAKLLSSGAIQPQGNRQY